MITFTNTRFLYFSNIIKIRVCSIRYIEAEYTDKEILYYLRDIFTLRARRMKRVNRVLVRFVDDAIRNVILKI